MAATTPEEFADDLDNGLAWRRSELAALRSEIEKLTPDIESRPRGRMLLRAAVALLYAHWEGFVTQGCQSYLDYVARRRLKFSELNSAFQMTAVRPIAVRATRSPDDLALIASLVAGPGDARALIPRTDVVSSGSNLRYDRLIEMFARVGLSSGSFDVRRHLIDQRLCDARNEITHGKDHFPTGAAVLELQDLVVGMLEEVRGLLQNAVAMGEYRAPNPQA